MDRYKEDKVYEFLDGKGIDTGQIVSYYVPDGIEHPIDIDILQLLDDYHQLMVKGVEKKSISIKDKIISIYLKKWGKDKISLGEDYLLNTAIIDMLEAFKNE
jgi:hypothetical protein